MPGGPLWAIRSSATLQPITRARCNWETGRQCSRRRPFAPATRSRATPRPITRARCNWETGRQCSAANPRIKPAVCGERDALPRDSYLSFNAHALFVIYCRCVPWERNPTMIGAPLDGPLVEFFQIVPNPRPPQRADRAVGGVIPARALRYCEAITSASAFGWYVFLPISFKVVWDGHDMLWTYDGVQEWLPLTRDAVQYPHFSEQFNEIAPPSLRGFSPPFLTPSIQPGGLQVWTGCIAKSAPGWSLLVRGVANLSSSASYQMFEGIIETDDWFGPLFNNVRIIKTDVPIEFRSDVPFLQVQPVHKDVYADKFLRNFTVKDLGQLSRENWQAFHRTVVVPNVDPERKRGQYAVSVRKGAHHPPLATNLVSTADRK